PPPPEEEKPYPPPGLYPGPMGIPPKGAPIPPPPPPSAYAIAPLVTTVQFARESGDPILPDVAVAWGGAITVVVPSDVLGRMQGQQLESLAQWVLSGGTLAVSLVREEDLRTPNLVRLLGGEAHVVGNTGTTVTFNGPGLQKGSAITGGDEGDVASFGMGE